MIIKCLHKEQYVLDNFIKDLNNEFGQEKKLEEISGLSHKYLKLTIEFSLDGKVVFSMFDYLEDIIVEAHADMKHGIRHKNPASKKLSNFDEGSLILF